MIRRFSRWLRAAPFALLALASASGAATLTITPDKSVYLLGEEITLSILGDSEGASASSIFGTILFDSDLASFVSSDQVPLTSFDGALLWEVAPLESGGGFAQAFDQVFSVSPGFADGPLVATVVLRAEASGLLAYSWETGLGGLSFFGLSSASGGSVVIVPEPGTGVMLAGGLIAVALWSTRRSNTDRRLGAGR